MQQPVALVAALPPARTLDVACGTALLTRHLEGLAVGLDQSPAMVAIAHQRLRERGGLALTGDALALPFADGSRHRVLKRFLSGPDLAAEVDREILLDGAWSSAVRTTSPAA